MSASCERVFWQDRLNGVSRVIGHGCNCNRSTLDAIRAAGFTITELEHDKLPKSPPTHRPLVVGTATASGGGTVSSSFGSG